MQEISEEEMQELIAQMSQVEAEKGVKKINKKMIPIVMLTAPVTILSNILRTMMARKFQAQQQKMLFEIFMKEMRRNKGKCNCAECNGNCHE